MAKNSIAVDLDDVLASHAEAFVQFSNDYYNTNLTVNDYNDHWAEIWNASIDEAEKRSSEFHSPDIAASYKVKFNSLTSLSKLSNYYNLYVVTARRQVLLDATNKWIEENFSGVFSGVHFVPIWEPNNTVTKADICRKIGATYLIDDLPNHCNIAAQGGITAILFGNYSWNKDHALHDNVYRCKDWDAVLQFFKL